jgi:hypothetical protein
MRVFLREHGVLEIPINSMRLLWSYIFCWRFRIGPEFVVFGVNRVLSRLQCSPTSGSLQTLIPLTAFLKTTTKGKHETQRSRLRSVPRMSVLPAERVSPPDKSHFLGNVQLLMGFSRMLRTFRISKPSRWSQMKGERGGGSTVLYRLWLISYPVLTLGIASYYTWAGEFRWLVLWRLK